MTRGFRRLLRRTDRETVRQVTLGLTAVVVMIAIGVALQAGRSGGPSSADAASDDGPGGPATTVSSAPPTSSTLPPTTVPGRPVPRPRIVSFDVPARVSCGTVTSIKVRWATSDATIVKLDVDASGAFQFDAPTGSARLPFPCDGGGHSYRLVAVGADGHEVAKLRRVEQAS